MKFYAKNKIYFMLSLIIIIGLVMSLGASKFIFQKACLRREKQWPDLGVADDWQYGILTDAYKIKKEENKKITITASDGTKLVGHYYERKKNAPVVIFFHGLWSNCYTDGVPIYRITEKNNWNILLVNLRAHGESEGAVSTFGALEKYDCRDWANWVTSEFGEKTPIFLMGLSMGGAIVMMSSDLELPESVCGIIDNAGFTSSLEMIKLNSKTKLHQEILTELFTLSVNVGTRIWGGFNLADANSCTALSRTKIPVLMIHGDQDTRVPISMAYNLYNSCQSPKQLYIFSGAGHTDCYEKDPEKYERIICEFIEKNRKGELSGSDPGKEDPGKKK